MGRGLRGILRFRARAMWCAIALLSVTVDHSSAFAESSKSCSAELRKLKPAQKSKWVRKALVSVTLGLGAAVFGPAIGHDLVAAEQGMEHLGSGIYLDLHTVLDRVRSDYRGQIQRLYVESRSRALTKEEALFVADVFSLELSGDYDDRARGPEFFPGARRASDYMAASPKAKEGRGVCRHKAMVLTGVLQQFGVRAETELNLGFHAMAHVWVSLPNWNLVVDPTNAPIAERMFLGHRVPSRVWTRAPYLERLQRDIESAGGNIRLQIISTRFGPINSWVGGALR